MEKQFWLLCFLPCRLNSLLTSDNARYVYIGISDRFRCEQGKHFKLDSFLNAQILSLFFEHLTSSFIPSCGIIKASITANKRKICSFIIVNTLKEKLLSLSIQWWDYLHQVLFIEMRLKGHPIIYMVVTYLPKILRVIKFFQSVSFLILTLQRI